MLHPFISQSDLEKLTSEQLQTKVTELLKRRTYILRMQPHLLNQLDMMIDSYRTETARRDDEAFKKLQMQNNIRISKS